MDLLICPAHLPNPTRLVPLAVRTKCNSLQRHNTIFRCGWEMYAYILLTVSFYEGLSIIVMRKSGNNNPKNEFHPEIKKGFHLEVPRPSYCVPWGLELWASMIKVDDLISVKFYGEHGWQTHLIQIVQMGIPVPQPKATRVKTLMYIDPNGKRMFLKGKQCFLSNRRVEI